MFKETKTLQKLLQKQKVIAHMNHQSKEKKNQKIITLQNKTQTIKLI